MKSYRVVPIALFFFSIFLFRGCTSSKLMINAEGEMVEVDKDDIDDAIEDGYVPVDEAGSVGIEIQESAPPFVIYKVVQGSPASALGIKEGDLLMKISDTEPPTYQAASALLFGRTGTNVDIVVKSSGAERRHTLRRTSYSSLSPSSTPTYGSSRTTYTGERGGVYHYSKSGKKVYESSKKKSSSGRKSKGGGRRR
jgi:membrane-associated protease RseP (regulator of RpoE activity)